MMNKRTDKTDATCYFCDSGNAPDYKDVLILKRHLSDRGKILSSSKTGVCSKHQRGLSAAIKNARFMALLPYTDKHSI